MQLKDTRIKLMNEILNGIKVMLILGTKMKKTLTENRHSNLLMCLKGQMVYNDPCDLRLSPQF